MSNSSVAGSVNATTPANNQVGRRSLWADAFRRLAANRMALFGAGFVLFVLILAIVGPMLSPYKYDQIHWDAMNAAPSSKHLCGTDELGRDLCTRVFYGARVSMAVGVLATLVSVIIGILWGATAGFVGGRVDSYMMRMVDVLYAMPFMFFVILLMTVFGRNIYNLFIALGAVQWLTMSRIVRGQVLSLKQKEFVESARAIGLSWWLIIARHLVRNLLGPVIVYATLMVPAVMIEEAFLSFLGLGVQPPMSSWGSLINEGARTIDLYPWHILFPGASLSLTLLSLNFLGDGLRDALDPKMDAGRAGHG